MTQSAANRIYLDSGVLIKWQYGDSHTLPAAQRFLKDVSSGKYEGIISLLAVKEFVKFIRNLSVANGDNDPQKWLEREKRLLDVIWRLKGVKIIEGTSEERAVSGTNLSFADVSMEALTLMKKYGGSVKRNPNTNKMEHDGIHPMDALHIAVAKGMGCSKIATFDNDFIETKAEIEPMRLGSVV